LGQPAVQPVEILLGVFKHEDSAASIGVGRRRSEVIGDQSQTPAERDPVRGALCAQDELHIARRPVAGEESIAQAVKLLGEARRPLLAIASGANRTRTCHRIRQFVDAYEVPFITTQMGKGVVDERNPSYVGTASLSSDDFVHRAVEEADLLLSVGHNVVEKPPFIMKKGGVPVVHIDFGSAEVDPVYFPQVEVVGDIANSFRRIMEGLGERPERWDFSRVERIRVAAREHIESRTKDPAFPLRPQRIVADLRGAVPDDGIVCLDNGMYKLWFARNFTTYHPNSLLLDNALATMGAGLPTAMGAKMVQPDRPVVELFLAGATPALEPDVVGRQTLKVLGAVLLAPTLTPARRGSGL
jgi:acetolactate synthase-1/2/3 large subunit